MFKLFKLFVPTEDKVKFIGRKLMDEYLYISDEYRDYAIIYAILNGYVNMPSNNVIYEIGDFDGILVLANIIPGWKAGLTFKLWNKKRWGPDFMREGKEFIAALMKAFKLQRLDTTSPDPRIIKMAKICGFKIEGTQKQGFSWDGKRYDNVLLAIVREENDKIQ